MSPAQICDLIMPRKFPTNLYSCPPSHNFNSVLYPFDKPQNPRYWKHQANTAMPTPRDETLQAPRYHDLSYDCQTQKYRVRSEHMVPQPDVSKHGTWTTESQQSYYLQGDVNNASGPKRCQGPYITESQQNYCPQGGVNNASGPKRCQGPYKSSPQKAHRDAGSSKPCGGDDRGRRARDPGQGTAAVTVSLRAENTQPNGCHPPGAPSMRSIPLPQRQEGDEYKSYYYGLGLATGSLLTGTVQVDNVQNDLSCLDVALPVPFS